MHAALSLRPFVAACQRLDLSRIGQAPISYALVERLRSAARTGGSVPLTPGQPDVLMSFFTFPGVSSASSRWSRLITWIR